MERVVHQLSRLPGIGPRSAQRLAFYLLKADLPQAQELAQAILDLKNQTRQCSLCFNLTDREICPICSDVRRDAQTILVVEQPSDVQTLEASGAYRGVYHVLMGCLSPLEGVTPEDLNIQSLLERIDRQQVREVIVGTHPTLQGDGTGLYIAKVLSGREVKVTRLARGLPTGYHLELASKAVLADAIQSRQAFA